MNHSFSPLSHLLALPSLLLVGQSCFILKRKFNSIEKVSKTITLRRFQGKLLIKLLEEHHSKTLSLCSCRAGTRFCLCVHCYWTYFYLNGIKDSHRDFPPNSTTFQMRDCRLVSERQLESESLEGGENVDLGSQTYLVSYSTRMLPAYVYNPNHMTVLIFKKLCYFICLAR